MRCQICDSHTAPVLDLGNHPLCDDLKPITSSNVSKTYPIEIVFCENCLTAYQRVNVDKNTLFPSTYHYRSRMTGDVLKGMENLVDSLDISSTTSATLLDVGSNDGSLLNFASQKGFNTIGIEPTGAYLDSLERGHSIYNSYFDVDIAKHVKDNHGYPDFITFTNVFAHIDDLDALLDALAILIGPTTRVVIENHYLGAVIQRNQFDTFYHEHPRTYSLHSFHAIAKRLNLNLSEVFFPSRYGGNIRVQISSMPETSNLKSLLEKDLSDCKNLSLMQSNVDKWIISKGRILADLVSKYGPLPSKAFPGRAAILYKLLDLNSSSISCAYEQDSSQKIGYFIPGTNIPIEPDSKLLSSSLSPEIPIINNAWHISSEISAYLRSKGVMNPIIDLIDPSDFD